MKEDIGDDGTSLQTLCDAKSLWKITQKSIQPSYTRTDAVFVKSIKRNVTVTLN